MFRYIQLHLGYAGVILVALIGLACSETDRKLVELERKVITLPEPGTYLTEFDRSWEKVKSDAVPKLKKEVFDSLQKPESIAHRQIRQALNKLEEIQQAGAAYLAGAKTFYEAQLSTHDRAKKVYLYLRTTPLLAIRLAQHDITIAAAEIRRAADEDAKFEIASERDENMRRAIAMRFASAEVRKNTAIELTGLYQAIEKDIAALEQELTKDLPQAKPAEQGSAAVSEVTQTQIPDKTVDDVIKAAHAHPDAWKGNQMIAKWFNVNFTKLTWPQMIRLQKSLQELVFDEREPNGSTQTWSRMVKKYYFHFVTGSLGVGSAILMASAAPYNSDTNIMLESYLENHKKELAWKDVEKIIKNLEELTFDERETNGATQTRTRIVRSYFYFLNSGKLSLSAAIAIADAAPYFENRNCMLESYFLDHKSELAWKDVEELIRHLAELTFDQRYKLGKTQVSRRILDEWSKMTTGK